MTFIGSCSQWHLAYDPMEHTPKSPNNTWGPLSDSRVAKVTSFTPTVPNHISENTLSLAEIIDIALINNPLTKKTWAEAKAAAANYGQSLSPYYPEINANATYTREKSSYVIPGHAQILSYYLTTVDPEISLAYTIFDFGERKSSSEQARQTLLYADWMHNQQIQNVMISVINSYYLYLGEQENLRARIADVKNAKEVLNAANREFVAGTASLEDIAQAKTKYFQMKIDWVEQKQMTKSAYAQLITDLGLPANMKISLQKMPKNIFTDPIIDNIDSLVEKAQKHRPDFLAAKADVESKRQNVLYAQSLTRPKIEGDFVLGKNYYNNNIQEDYHFTLEFSLSFPIFKGFYYRNGIKKAESLLFQSKAILEKTELGLIQDVTDAHIDVISANGRVHYTQKYYQSAYSQYDIALKNYQAGTNTILDLISAQTALADARAKKINARKDLLISLAKLAYATGSLGASSPEIAL
ncbi:MAG: TolC family protein [Parachlamydiales bacterium]|nr:TolC family protein [Parachlamydiales bacterium]